MIDSHAHLGLCEPDDAELVSVAVEAGVTLILTVGLGEDSNPGAVETARAHDEVFAAVGRHPNAAAGFDDEAAAVLEGLARGPEVVAVGETGLDFYRDGSPRDEQRRAFSAQIEIARRVAKPLVVHIRNGDGPDDDAVDEAFVTLATEADDVEVLLHCFSASPERVEEASARGWLCSFAGNVTYPRAGELREAARRVPDELLLVETDSPFLAPQPVRGRPNQPANVVATAELVARTREVSYVELERLVEANAARAFGW